jgi:beta-1,4-mannosyl-glycoprotein beta-1,4-N-acetylglucosaminyltransferase
MLTAPETNREFLVFFCVMIGRKATEAIGLLDEIFNPGYAEDCDFAMRAVNAGWKIQQVPSSQATLIDKGCEDLPQYKRDKMWSNPFPCYHDGNQTFSRDPEKYQGLIDRNSAILRERYSVKELNTWRAKTIDGWFAEGEIDWLAQQVAALPEGATVVEVGSWKGRSSRAIADNLPAGAKLYCVDTFSGSSGEPDAHLTAKDREGDDTYMSFFHNLHDHLDSGRVIAVRMSSLHAAETMNNLRPQLIFIDGAHDYESVKADIEAWLPLLAEGGLICGHDYYAEGEGLHWVGVRQAVEEKFPRVQKAATSIWHVRPHAEVEHPRGRVFDCFLYHNEEDVLGIRLATLNDVVDYFVIAEGTKTHSGSPKPLHFDLNKEKFAPYLDKIRHIVVDDWPADTGDVYADAWAKERWQRDAVMHGLYDAQPNDIVIIGDADEIASPEAVANYKVSDGLVRLKQRMFYYYLNCENKEGWDWQKIAPYSLVKERTPCGIRYPPAEDVPLVENGGWHFSMMGGAEAIQSKLVSYSHQEYNSPEFTDLAIIAQRMNNLEDLFGR